MAITHAIGPRDLSDATLRGRDGCFSVIVTYNPVIELLKRVVDSASRQTDFVVIVDNGSSNVPMIQNITGAGKGKLSLIRCSQNRGIAWALNAGINECRRLGADFMLALDQDTVLTEDCVRKMLEFYHNHCSEIRLGVIAPTLLEYGSPPASSEGYKIKRMALTTGSLVPLLVYDDVGLYNESLFLYHVDDEFCIRVRRAGYRIAMLGGALAYTREGDARVWWFNLMDRHWESSPARKPQFLYYIARNGVYISLYIDPHFVKSSFSIIRQNLMASVGYYKRPFSSLLFVATGILDGLLARLGKFH